MNALKSFIGHRIIKITGNEIYLDNGAFISVHPMETSYVTPSNEWLDSKQLLTKEKEE